MNKNNGDRKGDSCMSAKKCLAINTGIADYLRFELGSEADPAFNGDVLRYVLDHRDRVERAYELSGVPRVQFSTTFNSLVSYLSCDDGPGNNFEDRRHGMSANSRRISRRG